MVREPLFFQPDFKERIWGGSRLTTFGYTIPSNRTGECWAFAAHSNGQSVVKHGEYQGKTLGQLWENHREIFGRMEGDCFPLLTKILDADQDLSVQVHPDDDYAFHFENGELGKTECWYIIDCEEGAEIIYGHHAQTKEEFANMINQGKWTQLLRRVPVKPGDFFYVPSGTLHAIGKGIVILETQQNSDTTYRVYDYDRRDHSGNLRELHVEQSIAVTTVPSIDPVFNQAVRSLEGLNITTFVQAEYFTVHKWELNGKTVWNQNEAFELVSVLQGQGVIRVGHQEYFFKKGDQILLPFELGEFTIEGTAEMIVSHV